jgi:hypothetical protein
MKTSPSTLPFRHGVHRNTSKLLSVIHRFFSYVTRKSFNRHTRGVISRGDTRKGDSVKLFRTILTTPALALFAGIAHAQPAPAPAAAPPPPAAAPAPPAAAPTPPAAAPTPPVAAPPAVAPAPAPGPVGVVVPAAPLPEVPPPPPPAPPKALAIGKDGTGLFQPSALLQFWAVASRQSVRAPADKTSFFFRLRRAELKIKGDIVPERIQYQLMVDGARVVEPSQVDVATPSGGTARVTGASSAFHILNDFFVTFSTDYVDISVGQFKVPLGYEGYNSSSKILFPERAPIERFYGDRRDIGLRLEKKIGDYVGYSAGIWNGTGQNRIDDDQAKDGGIRLEVYPIKGLTVAGVGYMTLGKRKKVTRDRLEADLRYEGHNALILVSHISGFDRKNGAKAIRGRGSYVQLAYTLFDHLQPMARFGEIEPDTKKFGDHYRHYEGGVAWLFQKNEAKITLGVAGYDPTHTDHKTNVAKTEAILSTQASF